MKQIVPIFQPQTKMKKVLFFFLSVFLFSGSLLAQNPDDGGTIGYDQAICVGETPNTIVGLTPATGGDTNLPIEYMWMSTQTPGAFPGGPNYTAIPNSNSPNYSPGVLNATTWFVRCARRIGSGDLNFTAETNPVQITVYNNPTTIFTPSTLHGYSGISIDFDAVYAGFGALYRWDLTGNGIFNNGFVEDVSWTYNFPGTYEVSLMVTDGSTGCSFTTSVTIVIEAPTAANIFDPCGNCDDPFNIADFTGGAYYNHDYTYITSNTGETWTIINVAPIGGGIVDGVLNPIPVGTIIPETGPGVYFSDIWFNGVLGGWQITVQNNNGITLITGPGATAACPICPESPLPVELTSFKASVDGKVVLLAWETASEVNNSHFEIERSIDGNRFETLGTVDGKGTTSQASFYKFEDTKAIAGETYYRLKQVDLNGASEYSNIEVVRIATDATIVSVSPNPVTKSAVVRLGNNLAPKTNLELLNPTGQIVRTFTVIEGASSLEINLENLAEGIYFLSVENASREQKAFYKVVKF